MNMLTPKAERPSVEARPNGVRALLLGSLLVACGSCFGVKADQSPNILMIAVDDMNDWIGCHGTTPAALTPNIDRLAEQGLSFTNAHTAGVFNATGPAQALTMGTFLETTRTACNPEASLTWVPDDFLEEHKVGPWMEMPLWIPGTDLQMICTRAIESGLTFRPVEDTARDTLEWSRTRPADHDWRAGMKREREAELLRAWHTTGS